MTVINHDNLVKELSILGKDADLSLTQRQAIRDRLFKKIGQTSLIDAVQTQTEVEDLVMPLTQLQRLFNPKRIVLSLPATVGMLATVFVATFTTSAFARTAQPGDPLFGVRKAFEAVQIVLASDPTQKAELKLSIVNDRFKALETTGDSKKVEAILNESKKALASAQASIATLPADKSGADLNAKLKSLIETQKTALSTIAKGNANSEDVKKTVLAMRDELDKLIAPAPAVDKPDSAASAVTVTRPVEPTDGFVTLSGTIGTYTGEPVLLIGDRRYYLRGATINLIPYMGSDRAVVFGTLTGNTIRLTKLTINNQLIWEYIPDENDNNLPRVEGDKNTSLR